MDAATIQVAYRAPAAAGLRSAMRLGRWISLILGAALISAALAVAARRLAGGLFQPLSSGELLLATLGAAVLAIGSRSASNGRLSLSAISLGLVTFLGGLSVRGTPTAGLAGAWAVVLIEEVWAWWTFLRNRHAGRNRAEIARPLPSPLAEEGPDFGELSRTGVRGKPPGGSSPSPPFDKLTAGRHSPIEGAGERLAPLFFPPPDVSPRSAEMHQQLTRASLADGADRLAGWLQATFAPGERTSTVHVAFCPPFAEPPKVSLRQTSGPATRIKPGQILAHGVRLELKLNFASRAAERVLVEFAAESRDA
jgi:hypothetical protein